MSESTIAERIKHAITSNGGYNLVSEKTGISSSTLVRTASGKTEPKLKDVISICHATGMTLNYIAYGMLTEDEESAASDISNLLPLLLDMTKVLMQRQNEVEHKLAKLNALEERGSVNDLLEQKQFRTKAKQHIENHSQQLDDLIDSHLSPNEAQYLVEELSKSISNSQENLTKQLSATAPNKSK